MMGVIIWREAGFAFVLFLARLLSLPQETQEAARIDGAGFFSLHWRITIPQLRSVIWFYAVIEGITMISWVFNYVYIMSNGQGGPGDSTMVTELYIYQNAFQFNAPQLAAAAAALLFTALVAVFAVGLGVRALVLWSRSRSKVRSEACGPRRPAALQGGRMTRVMAHRPGGREACPARPRPRVAPARSADCDRDRAGPRVRDDHRRVQDPGRVPGLALVAAGLSWSFRNFGVAVSNGFGRWLLNSLIVTSLSVAATMALAASAAWGDPAGVAGKQAAPSVGIALMVIPPVVLLVPLFSSARTCTRFDVPGRSSSSTPA